MISAKNDFGVFPIIPKLKIRAADSTGTSTVKLLYLKRKASPKNSLRIKGVGWVGQKNN
jgi:hypothetical protein